MPRSPFVTCNVDASFSNDFGRIRLGMVVRDSCDRFLLGQSSSVDGYLPIREEEAIGVKKAMS